MTFRIIAIFGLPAFLLFLWAAAQEYPKRDPQAPALASQPGSAAQRAMAAQGGSSSALFMLGLMYLEGDSVPKDYAEALRLFRRAAAGGNARAQFHLGSMLLKGQGIARNEVEAAKWYILAAEQGHVSAQSNVGMMFAVGAGVEQDLVQAYKWTYLAVERSAAGPARDRIANNLEITARRMTAAELSEAKKIARDWWENFQKQ